MKDFKGQILAVGDKVIAVASGKKLEYGTIIGVGTFGRIKIQHSTGISEARPNQLLKD